jgi:hypothetical protein
MDHERAEEDRRPEGILRGLCVGLMTLGFGSRLWPFLEGGRKYLERFPTEDGYLMLTIARNLALGKGFSTADGTMPTNGTQPLTTFLWSALFLVSGGDRERGVALVLGAEIAIGMLAAWLLHRLALRLLDGYAHARPAALLAASLWFGSPLVVPHSMNCLESGFYALFILLSVGAFHALAQRGDGHVSWVRVLGLGSLLGITFWARNDAVFLIAAMCLTYVAMAWQQGMAVVQARLIRAVVFGATSVVIALPWLTYNVLGFGSLMPISGRAESHEARLGGNALAMLTTLVENITMTVPVPETLQSHPAVAALMLPILGVFAWVVRCLYREAGAAERAVIWAVGGCTLTMALYYGLFFGARWFVPRYVFAVSPFFAMVFGVGFFAARERAPRALQALWTPLFGIGVVGLAALLTWRGHTTYTHHPHFQVVRWVNQHVPARTWIGATQTGTLGFYHDRTINFDGKVNPDAYYAIVEGRAPEYIADSPIEYVADWNGVLDWMNQPAIRRSFKVLVDDADANLAVLQRRDR